MTEVPLYEESGIILHGRTKLKPKKFHGRTSEPCYDFAGYTGGMAEELGVAS